MERRKYRNLLNQPLPVRLLSESLSVGAKGYFDVEEPDFNSPELERLKNAKQIKLIETSVKKELGEEAAKQPESPPLPSHGESPEVTTEHTGDASETSEEENSSEVTDDSLTSPPEMMESDESKDDAGEVNDEPPKANKKKKTKKRGSGGKQTASRG